MVMEALGPSIEDLFQYCGKQYSIKTTCMIIDQIIQRLETLHLANLIHRDIKPDNFLIGIDKKQLTIHMIDLGLAKRYINPSNGKHITFKDNLHLTGTARYASRNSHLGFEQSRRDDLEAVCFMMVYFMKG